MGRRNQRNILIARGVVLDDLLPLPRRGGEGLRLDTSLPQQPISATRKKSEENRVTYQRHIVVFAHGGVFALVMRPVTVSLDKPISSIMIETVLFAQR